ncbi:MAG: hypothetical protein QM770_21265 [Tepidisphaeraceae bacterium]
MPHNSLYDIGDNRALESSVRSFVEQGGVLLHGPHCLLAQSAFDIRESPVEFDCIAWDEPIIPHGWSTVAFDSGEPLGTYIQTGKTGIARTQVGSGRVYSFGFQYGHAYSRRTMPIVPPNYGKREMHPIVLLERTPCEAIVGTCPHAPLKPTRGLEMARFGRRAVIVNHRSSPIELKLKAEANVVAQVPSAAGWLAAHSAACVELV